MIGGLTMCSSAYSGHSRKASTGENDSALLDSALLDKMNAMSVKIEELETNLASRQSANAKSFDENCSVHGHGRRSLLRGRRCICT
jgi:hypothetical protein